MRTLDRLRAGEVDERLVAIAELAGRGHPEPEELHALVECLGGNRKVVQRRAAEAFATLHHRGIAVTDILLAALHSSEPQRRWGAAYALSRIGVAPAHALPVLVEGLDASDGDLRWAAADIVIRMEHSPALVNTLRDLVAAGNPLQRKMAAYCLRDLDARSAAVEATLFAALHDAEPGVRMAAMSALARLCVARAALAARLLVLLDDPDAGVRRAAAVVLGTLGEPSEPVLAALRSAAVDGDPSLQRAAERSLRLLCANDAAQDEDKG